jgi:hypothetical protein
MSDFLDELNSRQAAKVASWGIAPGDFVQLDSWCGDVWAEVASVSDKSLFIFDGRRRLKTRYESFEQVRAHKPQGHVWGRGELRILHLSDGDYGRRDGQPLPARFLRATA